VCVCVACVCGVCVCAVVWCVCVCVCVVCVHAALFIQHAMHMSHIATCGLPDSTTYFHIIS